MQCKKAYAAFLFINDGEDVMIQACYGIRVIIQTIKARLLNKIIFPHTVLIFIIENRTDRAKDVKPILEGKYGKSSIPTIGKNTMNTLIPIKLHKKKSAKVITIYVVRFFICCCSIFSLSIFFPPLISYRCIYYFNHKTLY